MEAALQLVFAHVHAVMRSFHVLYRGSEPRVLCKDIVSSLYIEQTVPYLKLGPQCIHNIFSFFLILNPLISCMYGISVGLFSTIKSAGRKRTSAAATCL